MERKSKQMNNTQESQKIWNPVFISIFITNLLICIGQEMVNAMLPKYADFLGAPPAKVGLIISMFAYTALIFKFISAPAIDTLNRKHIITIAAIIMTIAFVGYSVTDSIPMLMILRLLQGSAMAFTTTSCLVLAADSLPYNKLGTGIGYYTLAQTVCQAVSPTIGLILLRAVGFKLTFAVGSFIMAGAAIASTRIKVDFIKKKNFKLSLKNVFVKEAFVPALLLFFLTMSFYNINTFLILYGGEQGINENIGLFFIAYALTLLISRPMVGKLTDKYSLMKILIPSMCVFAIALLIISFSRTLPMFLLAAFVSAFGYGACYPVIQALCMKIVPKERRGAGSSSNYIGMDLGILIGPVLAGRVAEKLGYVTMWRIIIIPVIIAIALSLLFSRVISPRGESCSEESG